MKPFAKPFAARKILLAILPAAVFAQNLAWLTNNTWNFLGFLCLWTLMIWTAWDFTDKNQVNERLLRLTEIAFFLLPVSAIVLLFVIGAGVLSGAQGDAAQAGAAIGIAIGGMFLVGVAVVIGGVGGGILHIIAQIYEKRAEPSRDKQPSTLAVQSGIPVSLGGLLVLAVLGGLIHAAMVANEPSAAQRAAQAQSSQAAATPVLEVSDWGFGEQYSFLHMKGQVKNISGDRLEQVQAVATYYDASGNFVTSDETLIDYDPLLPGQTSPFEILTRYNPAITKGVVSFKKLFGDPLPVQYR